ncbi:MAG: hypothetical protein Tsb0027_10330 [Wenzhouxiangellaceae bacterium]
MAYKVHRFFAIMALTSIILGYPYVVSSQQADNYIVKFQEPSLVEQMSRLPASQAFTRSVSTGRTKLNLRSSVAQDMLAELRSVQDRHLQDISRLLEREVQLLYRYDAAVNGVAISMTASEAARVASLPSVEWVQKERIDVLDTDRGPEFIGAVDIWDGSATPSGIGNQGEDMIIGILDSGINTTHPSFAATGDDGFTVTNPLGAGNHLGNCNPDGPPTGTQVNCNDKLIGAYGFADGPEDNFTDSSGHGTHVASTAGGNVVDGPFIDQSNGNTFDVPQINGVAPHANIIAYDVCTVGCPNTASTAAINQAILDGADAINFSIGPGVGGRGISPWQDTSDRGFLDAVGAGIFVASSAGNTRPPTQNPNPEADVSHRGPWIMTVANSSHDRVNSNNVSIIEAGAPAELNDMFGLLGSGPVFPADINGSVVAASSVDAANFEGCNPWTGTPFANSIALISRGTCPFADKVNNANSAGAAAVIVFNNQSNVPIVMGGLEATVIPSVMVGLENGENIESFLLDNPGASGLIEAETIVSLDAASGNVLNSSSLQGPNLDFDVTKPSITAPGTNIFAAGADNGTSVFRFLSGTSMSGPHVAGAGVLLMKEHPNWTVMEIKSAMMMTADKTTKAIDGVTQANPDLVGSGMIDLSKAAMAGLVMNESFNNMLSADPATGGDPSTVNIPSVRSTDCASGCSWSRTVRNALNGESSWTVTTSVENDAFTLDVSPSSFSLLPGDVLFRDDHEDASPDDAVSSVQTMTITAGPVSANDNMLFGEVLLNEDSLQSPELRITAAVSDVVPTAPPL